jgi:phospholipase C
MQENRSFENLFAGFPEANAPVYGYALHHHRRVQVMLHKTTFETDVDLPHVWQSGIDGWNKGKMDGFHTGPRENYAAYAYMDHKEIAPYWAMAKEYVLADAMFPSEFGGSFASHIMAVAGNDEIDANDAVVNTPNHVPNDCDAPPQTESSLVNSERQVGKGNGPFPCFTQFNTMAQVLDQGGISWRFYIKRKLNGGIYSPFEAISAVRYGPDWNNIIAPETSILTDIPNGKLAGVTWVIPRRADADLPGRHSDTGPSWVTAVVNAIGESKFWDSTAIIITWDEWGGWYDNAPPPQLDYRGLAIRVPCIIISPYAKLGTSGSGYVSHTQYEWGSMLKYIEETFGLPAIGPASQGYTDTRAASLSDSFDFTQAPRQYTPFTAKYPPSHFINLPPSDEPIDEDE